MTNESIFMARQLQYISQNGCNGIKCKRCVLNKMCSHNPKTARQTALTVFKRIGEGLNGNKNE